MVRGADRVAAIGIAALILAAHGIQAQAPQQTPLERGMLLEGQGKFAAAAQEYRKALGSDDYAIALLGLERSWHETGMVDSVRVLVDSILAGRKTDQTARQVQFRALRALGEVEKLRAAFQDWRTAAPDLVTPYREYARLLLESGKVNTADSVLKDAERTLTAVRGLAMEFAQVRVALGFWEEAADAWRAAVEDADYLDRAAVHALSPAPQSARAEIRHIMMLPPTVPAVRKALASLELNWGSPENAWNAIRELKGDSARNVWLDFADRAEGVDAWVQVREALLAALKVERDPAILARAARAAVNASDYSGALSLMEREARQLSDSDAARLFGTTHVKALALAGRADEAEAAAARYGRSAVRYVRDALHHEVALGWVRAGDVQRARRALAEGGAESGEITGWIALYAGDLRTARSSLRGYGDASRFPATVTAMALLGRTRADSSAQLGDAFLHLARGDTSRSAALFERAAAELPDVASLLLSSAARLRITRDTTGALAIWQKLVETYPDAPESPEADLEWARALRKKGDREGSIARLEHLILTYPGSALLPQARRELDSIRSVIPPDLSREGHSTT